MPIPTGIARAARGLSVATDNVIRIMCPNLSCQRVLAVPVHARGKLVRCRRCGMNIRIPPGKTDEEKQPASAPPEPA